MTTPVPNTPTLKQLDQVNILTTKNVKYMAAEPGEAPSPHGLWSVVGFVAGEVLIAKQGAIVKIPIEDIRKVVDYDIQDVLQRVQDLMYGKKQEQGHQAERSGD